MKRSIRWLCIAAFLAVCAGVILFLNLFTQSGSPFTYLTWEAGAVVSPGGAETPFDPVGPPPTLEEGDFCRLTATLPEERRNGLMLIFEATGLETAMFLDGVELWRSASVLPEGTANQGQVQIPLPEGGGETLTMELRALSDTALLPPMLRLTGDPTDQAGAIAYANYYGLPAGATALALVLLWGLFLLGASQGKPSWSLLPSVLAAVLLLVYRLSVGYGIYFLPDWAATLGSSRWLGVAAALALVLYLALHRERAFWKILGIVTAWSGAALLAAALVSHLRGGYLARLLAELAAQLGQGQLDGTLYWLTTWLVLVCTLLSAWELSRSILRTREEARVLALKNQLVLDNYRAIEGKLRESGRLRHEASHRLTALDALVQARDWDGLERCIASWRQAGGSSQLRFSEHIAVNAILQDAAGRAESLGIAFQASVMVPKALPILDEDLCALLMNLLDNALEGAARTPAEREKFIRFQMRAMDEFLPVLCENSFDGRVETDHRGELVTTKPDPASHGFGLAQMRAVAEKYGSVLDVNWTEERFTVQTALQISRET